MEPIEYQRMFQMEDRHWWFQSRLRMTEGLLEKFILPAFPDRKPRLLDIGCGTGLFLQRRKADCDPFGIDFSLQALQFCTSRGLARLARADAVRLPFPDNSFDLVTAFDLIEHVYDDHALVDEIHRILKPDGFLLATVPAHPRLWSSHDVSLHHFRRYRMRNFKALFRPDQWQAVRLTPSFGLILPIAGVLRISRRLRTGSGPARSDTVPVPDWLNRMMIGLHGVEAAWLRRFNLPSGLSLMTIQRKRAKDA